MQNNQILLKEIINAEVKESEFCQNESEYFEFFAATQILKNYNLSDDEILEGITDGGNDGGCDSAYLFLNGNLITADQITTLSANKGALLNFVIIQSKNTQSFKEDVIMKWKTLSANLLDLSQPTTDFVDRYAEAVLDKFQMFRDAMTKLVRSQVKVQIQYFYTTLASELHPHVIEQAEELKKICKGFFPAATIDVIFVDADKLMELYNADSEEAINLRLADRPIALGNHKDYVALVNIATYFKFITDGDGLLQKKFLESNVRDYQGNNSVNSAIADTLKDDTAEDFWWLNNGVTIISEEISLVNSLELLLVNPSIVNGLQTTTEIYNYFSANVNKLESDKRNILVRLIVPESEESRDKIIFATNNQTNISKSLLRVTDTIHLQIEMYFKSRGLYYDRRKNYYKNQKKKPSEIVGVSFLAQCLITLILRKPDFARARPSTLLTDDVTYSKLYGENYDLQAYYNAAMLGKLIKRNLSTTTDMASAEKSDVLFYLLYAVVSKVLGKKDITFEDIRHINLALITDKLIESTKEIVYRKYKELGGNGRVAKSNTFINEIDTIIGL